MEEELKENVSPVPVKDETLERMAREQRKFTILQRERSMNEIQKTKNHAAIMAGLCILGAAVAVHFNNQDINLVIQHELDSIYSWEALKEYLKDLGPLTTLLTTSAALLIGKCFSCSKKLKKAKDEFIDFNASLEKNNMLGGNENARSR